MIYRDQQSKRSLVADLVIYLLYAPDSVAALDLVCWSGFGMLLLYYCAAVGAGEERTFSPLAARYPFTGRTGRHQTTDMEPITPCDLDIAPEYDQ